MTMAFEIDPVSRATFRRFALKFNLALLIPYFMKASYLISVSRCLELYAIWMAMIAVILKERFASKSLNHWSETLWLSFAAAGFHLAYKASL